MIGNAVEKIVWVGKVVAFLVGLAVILAAVLAVGNALLGTGGPSLFGESYRGDPASQLAANGEARLAAEPVARRQIEYPRGFGRVNVTSATVTLSGSRGYQRRAAQPLGPELELL